MIDTESDPGAWADAIAHSPCMNVADYVPAPLGQAIADVQAGRVQRVCVPGKWRVWRDETGVRCERMGVHHG